MKSSKVVTKEAEVAGLTQLFNDLFVDSEKTMLIFGADEPIYLPAESDDGLHKILSTKDYFSSALHEISHWCVAGEQRRKLVDYGYWYEPDGRSEEQQRLFEKVEVKPQALEWLFTVASGMAFRLSVDNINQPNIGVSESFKLNVHRQAIRYIKQGLPERAEKFLKALLQRYQPKRSFLSEDDFLLENLQ